MAEKNHQRGPNRYAIDLARRMIGGYEPAPEDFVPIATLPDEQVPGLFEAIRLLQRAFAPRGVHLCTIRNVKSGRCGEDCAFCSQSRRATSPIDVYPLLDSQQLRQFLVAGSRPPVDRCSLVAAGRRLSAGEVSRVARAIASVPDAAGSFCASLGLLDRGALQELKEAGLTRYHCNLETARSHFTELCSTHTFDEKLATLQAARSVGLSLCAGGLFGVGESDLQVIELALQLRELQPAAVPANFLVPVSKTPLGEALARGGPRKSPLGCLKIIALLRFALPRQDILICGGRLQSLGEHEARMFEAGASGLMTGNYLTTAGRTLEQDLRMLAELGLAPRAPHVDRSEDSRPL